MFFEKLADVADVLKSLAFVAIFVRRFWTFLSGRWRRNSGHRAELFVRRRYLYIVSRRNPRCYADFRRLFAKASGVEVICDRRRHGDRRQRDIHPRVNHRKRERRVRNVDGSLLRVGWALVTRTN